MSLILPEAFEAVARLLPRIAEEGGDVESVCERDLIERISVDLEGRAQAEALVVLTRRILQSLSLLDDEALSRGDWRMASFPALLCARSLLSGLGDQNVRLLAPGFWEVSEFAVDRQRQLLRHMESQRRGNALACRPVRRVWVSWALMAFDGKFLLVRREDGRVFREGSLGEFVLPGGRASSADLAGLVLEDRLAFFDPWRDPDGLTVAGPTLQRTLSRELYEELLLDAESITDVDVSHGLIRHTEVEGAASAHALTEYFIQLFRVELKPSGKMRLLKTLADHPERFAWFSAVELAKGANEGGQTAFVDALRQEFGEALGSALDASQFDLDFGTATPTAKPFDLPSMPSDPLQIGPSGQERSVHIGLSESEIRLLLFLVAVRRGDPIESMAPGLSTVPNLGWLLISDEKLWLKARNLCAAVNRCIPESPLLSIEGQAIRINVSDSSFSHYSPSEFRLQAIDERRGMSYRLRLERMAIESEFGTTRPVMLETHVSGKLGAAIYGLLHGDCEQALQDMDTVKRMQRVELRPFLQQAGLRLLVRQVDGVPELYVKPR